MEAKLSLTVNEHLMLLNLLNNPGIAVPIRHARHAASLHEKVMNLLPTFEQLEKKVLENETGS